MATINELLIEAIKGGNLADATELLKNGADANAKDEFGHAALFYAAFCNHTELAELLIANRADVNAEDEKSRWPPLFFAAHKGFCSMTDLLIAKGARVNIADEDGRSLLHHIVFMGHVDVAKGLLDAGADVNAKDKDGNTPLFFTRQDKYIAFMICAYGADVNAKNLLGLTPLHWAVKEDAWAVVNELIVHRADVNSKDAEGRTPLRYAVIRDNEDIAQLLREHGAVE